MTSCPASAVVCTQKLGAGMLARGWGRVINVASIAGPFVAMRGIDPETGQYYDDTKRYVDNAAIGDADRRRILEGNARKVYPRIKTLL